MNYYGEFTAGKTVYVSFNTRATATGAPITLGGTPAVSVYKRGSTTESTSGVTLTVDYDARTGYHVVAIDTSADGTFYASGNDFDVVITTGTVDSVSVVGVCVGTFSLSNRAGLRPTTADRTLDVSAGGEAGVDWANVGSPTTTVGLSGTTVKTATDVETDTADIQARLPAALTSGGRMKASMEAILDTAPTEGAAGRLASAFTTQYNVASPVFTAASVNQTGDGFARLGAPAGLSVSADMAAVKSDTAAILIDTNELQTDWTNGGRLDLLLDSTLADTNELQTDWADGGRLDVILDARMAKTDLLPVSASVNDAGASTTVFITTLPSTVTNFYKDWQIIFTSGALAGVPKVISSYNGTTKAVTLSEALTSAPANGVTFDLFSNHTHAQADIASSVWTSVSRTLTAGTNIQLPSNGLDNINAWTVALIGNITGSLSGSVGSVTGNVGGNVVGSVGSVVGHTPQTGDSYPIVSSATYGNAALKTLIDTLDDYVDTEVAAIQTTLSTLFTTARTESYSADGAAATIDQMLYEIKSMIGEKAIVSTTLSGKKLDGTTVWGTFTLDSATTPTSSTRAT